MKSTFLAFFFGVLATPSLASVFKDSKHQHCIAWKAKKTMFFLNDLEPTGINCNIKTTLVKNGETIRLNGLFPIKSFDSDDSTRDEDVFSILKGETQPTLIFKSSPLVKSLIEQVLAKISGHFVLNGELKIARRWYPVKFNIKHQKKSDQIIVFDGVAKSKFSELGLEAPSVLAGIVADVEDDLEFHFRFRSDHIMDFALIKK